MSYRENAPSGLDNPRILIRILYRSGQATNCYTDSDQLDELLAGMRNFNNDRNRFMLFRAWHGAEDSHNRSRTRRILLALNEVAAIEEMNRRD